MWLKEGCAIDVSLKQEHDVYVNLKLESPATCASEAAVGSRCDSKAGLYD